MNNLKIISNLKWKIVLWILLFTMICLAFSYGKQYGINERIIILATLVLGVFTQIFAGITSLIAIIPFFGPFILKVVSIPKSRTVTFALLVGIIIGYILGNIIPLDK